MPTYEYWMQIQAEEQAFKDLVAREGYVVRFDWDDE